MTNTTKQEAVAKAIECAITQAYRVGVRAEDLTAEQASGRLDSLAAAALSAIEPELREMREALEPWAKAAKSLDVRTEGEMPFDDPNEVLWAGESGVLTVADFRRAQMIVENCNAD